MVFDRTCAAKTPAEASAGRDVLGLCYRTAMAEMEGRAFVVQRQPRLSGERSSRAREWPRRPGVFQAYARVLPKQAHSLLGCTRATSRVPPAATASRPPPPSHAAMQPPPPPGTSRTRSSRPAKKAQVALAGTHRHEKVESVDVDP